MRLKKSVLPNKVISALGKPKKWYLANLSEAIEVPANQLLNALISMQKKGKIKIGQNGNYILNK